MFERVLKRVREKICTRQFVMTLHADEEMNDDELTIYDIERAILTGKIVQRQRDAVTAESKYRIRGGTVGGDKIEVIVKESLTGKVVIMTVYRP